MVFFNKKSCRASGKSKETIKKTKQKNITPEIKIEKKNSKIVKQMRIENLFFCSFLLAVFRHNLIKDDLLILPYLVFVPPKKVGTP